MSHSQEPPKVGDIVRYAPGPERLARLTEEAERFGGVRVNTWLERMENDGIVVHVNEDSEGPFACRVEELTKWNGWWSAPSKHVRVVRRAHYDAVDQLLARAASLEEGGLSHPTAALVAHHLLGLAHHLRGLAHDLEHPECEDSTVAHLNEWLDERGRRDAGE